MIIKCEINEEIFNKAISDNKKYEQEYNKRIQKTLKKNDWKQAYDEYIKMYADLQISHTMFDMIYELVIAIKYIDKPTNEILNAIEVLAQNFLSYCNKSSNISLFIEALTNFIEKHHKQPLNQMKYFIQRIYNMIRENCKNQATSLPKIRSIFYEEYFQEIENMFLHNQITLAISKVESAMNEHDQGKILYIRMLLAINAIEAAEDYMNEIQNEELKNKMQHIINSIQT